ncbi:MAG: hypothetical protein QNJ60_03720 [Xenococcaceae cyanobacterium MO_188.B19]|nr:hypothetical protein [Xenococcaceae cyanobacterium MO_188.B19]
MINRDQVKEEVFEGVARLTSSYTVTDLRAHWILGGGASEEDSVGLAAHVITTNLITSMNFVIQVARKRENKNPHQNPLEKNNVGIKTTLEKLVDLVLAKIQ